MENLIDKYRVYIGVMLVVVILVGLGFLLYLQPKVREARQSNQNLEILQQQINDLQTKVSQIGNASAPADIAPSETGQVAGASTTSETPQSKINLNTADVQALDSLPGIGPVYAQRIIDYRTTNGPFQSIEDIQNVKGIGPKTFEKFKNMVTVE